MTSFNRRTRDSLQGVEDDGAGVGDVEKVEEDGEDGSIVRRGRILIVNMMVSLDDHLTSSFTQEKVSESCFPQIVCHDKQILFSQQIDKNQMTKVVLKGPMTLLISYF